MQLSTGARLRVMGGRVVRLYAAWELAVASKGASRGKFGAWKGCVCIQGLAIGDALACPRYVPR